MKKRRKLSLKKVMIAKIDHLDNIKGGKDADTKTEGGNRLSPSDSIPSDTGNAESVVIICAQGTTGNVCY